jgi:hypothetical protein
VRELDAEWPTDLVVLERGERWIRNLEPVPCRPTLATSMRGGVHLITGGFGGIGMSLAEHSPRAPTRRRSSSSVVLTWPRIEWPAPLEMSTTDPVLRRRIEVAVSARTYGAVVDVAGDVTDEPRWRPSSPNTAAVRLASPASSILPASSAMP